jgi:hypothetical protein
MLIPKGKVIHQNLATSYVLVEALVADLCEGGFAGVVEIMLRDTDNHIVFDRGKIAGIIEMRGEKFSFKSSVADLAAKSKSERGRLSIYSYAAPVAKALAAQINAETLYVKLSTEFADLEKLVGKFMRERERQWLVEVFAAGETSLIFIDDGKCSVIQSASVTDEGDLEISDITDNLALSGLIEKCNNTGGVFDVRFKTLPDEATAQTAAKDSSIAAPSSNEMTPEAAADSLPKSFPLSEASVENFENNVVPFASHKVSTPTEENFTATAREDFSAATTNGKQALSLSQNGAAAQDANDFQPPEDAANLDFVTPSATIVSPKIADEVPGFEAFLSATDLDELEKRVQETAKPVATKKRPTNQPRDVRILPTRELMALSGENENATEDLKMAEIKRLLGEIGKAIEDVLRIVEQRDDFVMHLRAGQLKLANQYAFLDPFGAEFEYLEGEIAFVGKASAEEFISGVTDALRLAVTSAAQASANPVRLRSFIVDKLRFLFHRSREDYLLHGLDASLEQISGVQFV